MPPKTQRLFPPLVRAPRNFWTGGTDGTAFAGRSIGDSTDVDLTGQTDGQIFKRVGGIWVPSGLNLDELLDVNASAPGDTEVLTWDAGTSRWIAAAGGGGGSGFDPIAFPADEYWLFGDCDHTPGAISGGASANPIGSSITGTAAEVIYFSGFDDGSVGTWRASTGTDTNGRAAILSPQVVKTEIATWTFVTRVKCEVLSVSGQRYALICGFNGGSTNIDTSHGVRFLYDEGGITEAGASANWQIVTRDVTTAAITDTGVPVVADQWYVLKIQLNATATSAEFFIDGVSEGTHTTEIPDNSFSGMHAINCILKSGGTTARTFECDYINVHGALVTSR